MTSEVGTDLRAVRPRGAGLVELAAWCLAPWYWPRSTRLVALAVESACQGKWRFFVMFAGAALSEKSPYLGSAQVRLSLLRDPWM